MSTSTLPGDGPHAAFLANAADDNVVRLELPGGGVHDCTIGQAGTLGIELAGAQATAVRTAAEHSRLPGMNVVVSITVGFESMRLIDGAATVHVVMPAGVTYRQAEAIADRHVAELRREATELPTATRGPGAGPMSADGATPTRPAQQEDRATVKARAVDAAAQALLDAWEAWEPAETPPDDLCSAVGQLARALAGDTQLAIDAGAFERFAATADPRALAEIIERATGATVVDVKVSRAGTSTAGETSDAEPRTLGDLTADDIGEWITVNGWHGQVARLEHLAGLAGKKWTCVLLIHVDRPSGDSAFVSDDSTTPLDPKRPDDA